MRTCKKILLFLSLVCLLALVLCTVIACDKDPEDPTPPESNTVTYSISVQNGKGEHMTDVIIKVMKGEEQIKMLAYKGQTVTFEAEADTYTLELDLSLLSGSYTFDESACTLTPEQKDATVRLYQTATQSTSVFVGAPISKDYTAYHIGVGSYRVTLTPNDYSFFIFRPAASAVYTVTYESTDELAISYHGSTFFVQGADVSEEGGEITHCENGLSISVYPGNINGDYVIGMRSVAATECVLHIENAGEPATRLEDQPWSAFLEDESKVTEQLNAPKNGTYTTVDVTDTTLTAVFNEADGYYHLGSADGPVLFIDLTTDSPYISSIQTICANQRMGVYIYDDDGNVVEKRSYNELFYQYGMPEDTTAPDEPVRVPLTAKLAEAIIRFGESRSWWAEGSEMNIFTKGVPGVIYNQAFAFLLFCGYYAE